jgi:hypothetical protein
MAEWVAGLIREPVRTKKYFLKMDSLLGFARTIIAHFREENVNLWQEHGESRISLTFHNTADKSRLHTDRVNHLQIDQNPGGARIHADTHSGSGEVSMHGTCLTRIAPMSRWIGS